MGCARALNTSCCCKEVVRSAQCVVAGRRCLRVWVQHASLLCCADRPAVAMCALCVCNQAWRGLSCCCACRCLVYRYQHTPHSLADLHSSCPQCRGCCTCKACLGRAKHEGEGEGLQPVCLCVSVCSAGHSQLQAVLLCVVLLDPPAAACVSVCCWTCQLGWNQVGCVGCAHRQRAGRAGGQLRRVPAFTTHCCSLAT